MKYLNILFIALLVGCSAPAGEDADTATEKVENPSPKGNSFSIKGTITGAANEVFFVEALTDRGLIQVSQAQADANGSFELNAEVPGFGEYYLRMGQNQSNSIPMVIVPGDKITVNGDASSYNSSTTFGGTEWSEYANGFLPVFSEYYKTMTDFKSKAASMSELEQLEFAIETKKKIEEYSFPKMDADPGNPFNLILFKSSGPQFDNLIGWDTEHIPTLKKVFEAFDKRFPNSPLTRAMGQQVQQIEELELVVNGKFSAPEIALPNPAGNEMKLSDLRGKYVLIDFWASWCGPCRRENPNVIRLYKKFKSKGFTVFSVSLDENPDHWKMAIEKDGLEWPNHVSDLKRWQSSLPQLYGFDGIPYTVLVNPEGKIIARGLRGATLEWKLKEIFSK